MEFNRNYVQIADEYAQEAANIRNKKRFGKWIRLAAKRYQEDRKRAKKAAPPFIFDTWEAGNPCDFIEKLPHVEGVWETPNIILHSSDVFFLVNLFGFRKHKNGPRRFSSALKAVARKNAKSTIAAGIGLYCEVCEGEVGPQVVSAATTGDQARIIFNIAKRMVEKTSALRNFFHVEAFANSIACHDNHGSFKPINSKASTQDGLNPSAILLDEIHAHKDHDMVNVLTSAAGARKNPLTLYTTTEGYETPGPWPELRKFAQQVLEGVFKPEDSDHFLVVIYSVDEEDDEFDESAWRKANPLMDANPLLLDEIRKIAIEAKAMPGKLGEFKIKRLNRQSATSKGWIDILKFKACAGAVDLDWLVDYPCFGALDLASNRDLASFRLAWLVENILYTWGRRWVCEEVTHERTVRGLVPYQAWIEAGYIEQTTGNVIDYDVIIKAVIEAYKQFQIQKIAYDKWNARRVITALEHVGIETEMFIQGPKSYHPAMTAFEHAYLAGNFRYGGDPVLAWNASNLVARQDENENLAPSKKRSADKIDDMVALLMAVGVTVRSWDEQEPKYQVFSVG